MGSIASLIRLVVGTSDGTPNGTPSPWKVVSGVGSVVDTSLASLITTLDAVVDTISGKLDVALSTRASEATLATRASEATLLSLARGTAQYISAAAEACASVKATPGIINSGMVYNQGAALAYLQFHNLIAAPAGGAVPTMVIGEVAAGETVPWPCSVSGTVGLQVTLSSTRDTYTAYANMRALLWRD